MNSTAFFTELAQGLSAKCERCGEDAVMRTAWVDWEERVFSCLYQCPRCFHVDWFAFQADRETKREVPEGGYL